MGNLVIVGFFSGSNVRRPLWNGTLKGLQKTEGMILTILKKNGNGSREVKASIM